MIIQTKYLKLFSIYGWGGIGFSGDVEVEDLGHAKYGEARNGKIIMNVLSPSFGPNGQNNFF